MITTKSEHFLGQNVTHGTRYVRISLIAKVIPREYDVMSSQNSIDISKKMQEKAKKEI